MRLRLRTGQFLRLLAILAGAIGCVVSGALVVSTYVEYYGDGPLHYGGMMNMDKWETQSEASPV